MERQMQEHSREKQHFDVRKNREKSSVRNPLPLHPQEEQQKDNAVNASIDTLSQAMTEKDHTRVAELAYVLYEQCGREDGHDLEHWLEAERQVAGKRSKQQNSVI